MIIVYMRADQDIINAEFLRQPGMHRIQYARRLLPGGDIRLISSDHNNWKPGFLHPYNSATPGKKWRSSSRVGA
jgi:hypothetical protein